MSTDHQRMKDSFDRDGYFFPVDVLDEQAAAEAYAGMREYQAKCGRMGGYFEEKWNSFKIHLVSAPADRLVHDEKLLDTVSAIIGDDLMVWSTSIFLRTAHSGEELPWHRDLPTHGWDGFSGNAVRVWLALTETTTANGTMRFLQGSHLPVGTTESQKDLDRNEFVWGEDALIGYEDRPVADVLLRPGQASLHQPLIVHGSGHSTSDTDRLCFAIDYISPEVRPTSGTDSALLVRGQDRNQFYWPEKRPRADFDEAAMRHFQESVDIRERYLFESLPE